MVAIRIGARFWGKTGTGEGTRRSLGMSDRTETCAAAVKMRSLAAELRGHAAETTLELYRRKFEGIASELEEAALDAESRSAASDWRPGRRQN